MRNTQARTVVWLYSDNHLANPILCQALDTLTEEGHRVTVLDRIQEPARPSPSGYTHAPLARPFTTRALARVLRQPCDLIIASQPDSLLIGSLIRAISRARLLYYPFELYGEEGARNPTTAVRLLLKVERILLTKHTDGVISQNQERAQVYTEERGARVQPTIVHNYKPQQVIERSGKLRALLGLPTSARIVLYEGVFIDGRRLENLIEAVNHLDNDVYLVFMGRENAFWNAKLAPLLSEQPYAQRIKLAPWQPPNELLSCVADADVGVIIYSEKTRNNYYCEPGKLSDYVLAGTPIVAPCFPTIEPIIHEYDIGACFDSLSPSAIAGAIQTVLSRTKRSWEPGLQRARSDLQWGSQASRFLGAVDEVLSK